MFVLIAMIMLWIPAVAHVDRLPLALGFAGAALVIMASFVFMVARLPREARQLVRRTVGRWVSDNYRRRPMIIPVLVEV